MRRTLLLLTVMAAALMLASGVAMAQWVPPTPIEGTENSDTIQGTSSDDDIYAYGGNDTVDGLEGNDRIYGGNGADLVIGGAGLDAVNGGYGTDDVRGGSGGDTLIDGPEDDTSGDTMNGGYGNDDIRTANVPNAKDTIICGDGYDLVLADSLDAVGSDCEDVTTTLTPEEEAQTDGPAPPGAYEDVYQFFGIAGTNCEARTDDVHRSKNANPPYSEALAVVGVRYCDQEKARIWVDVGIQRWVPYPGYWKNVRRIKDSNYNTRQNLKTVAYKCPTVRTYWYRSVLHNATIVDKDGDRHKMLYPRYGNERHFKCEPR